jgi:hypothetical protein
MLLLFRVFVYLYVGDVGARFVCFVHFVFGFSIKQTTKQMNRTFLFRVFVVVRVGS